MNTEPRDNMSRRNQRMGWAAGLLAAGALTGGLLATAIPATAASISSSSGTGVLANSATATQADTGTAPNAAGGQRPGETVLTGADADKAKAGALKALPGATIDRVETDADGAAYEAHVTKSDGTRATVKFDKDFNVTATEDGMGGPKK
jgi:hypothetical protein